MTQRDPSVSDKARALVEAGRALDEPSPADRERVRARLSAALGAAAVATTASKVAAAAVESGASAAVEPGASVLQHATGAGFGATKLLGSLGATLALVAAVSGVVWLRGSLRDSRVAAASLRQRPPAASATTSGAANQRSDTAARVSPTALEPAAARSTAAGLRPTRADRIAAADSSSQLGVSRPGTSRQRAGFERRVLPRDSNVPARDASAALPEKAMQATSPSAAARAQANVHAATTAPRTEAPPSAAAARAAVGVPSDPPPSATDARAAVGSPSEPPASATDARAAVSAPLESPPSAAAAPVPPQPAAAATRPSPTAPASSPSLAGELALLDAAQRALASGEPERALRQLDQHAARFPSGSLVPERLAARAVTLCRMQHNTEGLHELQRLQARAPASPLLAWAREACASHTGH